MMNEYTFKILVAGFQSQRPEDFDSRSALVLNDALNDITITIIAKELDEAFIDAQKELNKIIKLNFPEIPNINSYVLNLAVVHIKHHA